MFLEMGLYRSRIELLVMFEVVQHCLFIMKTSHKSDELKNLKKKGGGGGGSTNRVPLHMWNISSENCHKKEKKEMLPCKE